jgi:YidC/Oxa1 family membrane protein insertase
MDRKTVIIVLVCIGLFLGLNKLIDRFYPPVTVSRPVATNAVPVTQTVTVTNAQGGVVQIITTNLPAVPTASASGQFIAETNTPEELLVVTNENARYTFTTHGGGLKLIELVGTSTRQELRDGHVPTLNAQVQVPVMAILDGETVQGNGIFKLSPIDNGVRAEKELANGMRIVKEFVLSTNYLVSTIVRFENPLEQPLALPEQKWVVGTATPLRSDDRSLAEGAMWFDGSDTESMVGASYFSQRGFACLPRTPPAEFSGGQSNVYWAAVFNQFFALVAMTHEPAARFIVRPVDLPRPSAEEVKANSRVVLEPKGYQGAMVYPPLVIPPKHVAERQFYLYAGPKEYRTLARIASAFNNELDKVMGFGRFLGIVSKALLLGMNWLHSSLGISYGWAIIVITFIIKMLFWPLTLASTRSQKKMQLLQPQMKTIQEKYKDDPVKAQRKLMEFMKENKVSPLGGCAPMLLQMPVFIGFFYMLRSAIELRGASFLWVQDLSRPDTLFHIGGFPFNLLPLIMGATMLWQSHLTPPSPGMDPVQQKMMRYMPLIFLIFLYNYQAGLALYWTINNLLTIVQTKLTRMNPAKDAAAAKPAALTPTPKKKK